MLSAPINFPHIAGSCLAVDAALARSTSTQEVRALLQQAMEVTPQGNGSVWAHCLAVRAWAVRLLDPQGQDEPLVADVRARLTWWDAVAFSEQLGPTGVAQLLKYLAWHDCGKPFVFQQDSQGQVHFPEHAQASAGIWAKVGGSAAEQELMRLDMALHTASAQDLPALSENPLALALLVSAVASLQANADDFGGRDSTSYKAKLKHLDRRGRALCKLWAAPAPA